MSKLKGLSLQNQFYQGVHHWNLMIDAVREYVVSEWPKHHLGLFLRKKGIVYNGGGCAYCNNYRNYYISCQGCPISEKTGFRGCHGTPWYDFSNAVMHDNKPEALRHAIRMRDYILFSKPDDVRGWPC